ncbi:MAG: glycosyltransferase family 39 protein [Planctomycetes bacterium]|nr:glycosyltransferase family 39 protein [Planctomycetota bacterium]
MLALTVLVRLIGITRPLLGNFATRNVVYGMIARNWARGIADLWHPTVDMLQGGQRSLILLDFPVSAYATAGLWKLCGGPLDVWGRATSVAFSVASVALVYLYVRRRHGTVAAAGAAFALAVSPVGVVYGQSFMLEASLVCFTLGAFYALDRWLAAARTGWLLALGTCLALLLLTKVYMAVVLLPLAATGFRSARPHGASGGWLLAATLGLAVLPAACWYAFAYHAAAPDGPHAGQVYFSVRRSAGDHFPPHPLLGSSDFYRRVLDDLTGVVLTPIGFAFALAGLSDRRWRQHGVWLAATAVLVLVLPRKFYEMNYYYLAALPPLCVLAGLGWQVFQQRVRPAKAAVGLTLAAALLFSFRYALKPAFVTPEEDRGVIAAAETIRALTAEDEPVVTVHGTTIDLLYYCDRPGWALDPEDPQLPEMLGRCRREGARYAAIVGSAPMLQGLVACGNNYRIHRLPAPATRDR